MTLGLDSRLHGNDDVFFWIPACTQIKADFLSGGGYGFPFNRFVIIN